jgi:hypothetical protein
LGSDAIKPFHSVSACLFLHAQPERYGRQCHPDFGWNGCGPKRAAVGHGGSPLLGMARGVSLMRFGKLFSYVRVMHCSAPFDGGIGGCHPVQMIPGGRSC